MGAVCGYAGAGDAAALKAMLDALRHRSRRPAAGENTVGTRTHVGRDHGLGHGFPLAGTRAAGAETVAASADGRVRCVMEGHLFNADAVRDHLLGKGIALRDGGDAELVANLLAVEGTDGLDRLDGAFAVAAHDGDALILARDPLGERPLYFTRQGDTLLFASEIKAFAVHPGFRPTPEPRSLSALLVFSFIPGPRTMFKDVFELEPGSYLRWAPGDAPTPRAYFEIREDIDATRDEAAWTAAIAAACRTAVARRVPEDRKVSVFLSGGVDSSAVAALLAEADVHPVCFSVGFGFGQPNELGYARMVADHCRLEHRVIDVEPAGFLDLLPRIIWSLDDPLCDCITVPNFIMAEAASREAAIVFNGEGGDPLFGGPKNKFMILGEWYKAYGGYDRARAYLASYHKFYEYYGRLCTPQFVEASGGLPALEAYVQEYLDDPGMEHFLNRLMHLNTKLKGGQNILIKVDKMLSANGVQAASPLFDRRLTELAFRIPPVLKRQGDVEKYAFKKAIERLLPHSVVYRKKAGMGVPLNHWFRRTVLREYTADLLTSRAARERGYFEPSFVDDLLARRPPGFVIGRDRTGEMLWMLLAVELWHRVFMDGQRP